MIVLLKILVVMYKIESGSKIEYLNGPLYTKIIGGIAFDL